MNHLLIQYEEERKRLEFLLSFCKKEYLQEKKEKEAEVSAEIERLKHRKENLEIQLQKQDPKQNTKKYEAVDPLFVLLDNFRKDITHSYVFLEHFRWKNSLEKWKHDYMNVHKAMHVFPQYSLQAFDQVFSKELVLCAETSACLLKEIAQLEYYLKEYKTHFVVQKDDLLPQLKEEKRSIQKEIQKQQNKYIKIGQTFSSKRIQYIQVKELYHRFMKLYTTLSESTYIND